MRKLHTRKGGFTLIELMIVVAIIGILAAIAIPNFLQFQLRSKTGEGATNLAAIRTAEESYNAEFDTYLAAALLPRSNGALNAQNFPWPASAPGFDQLGWGPEGDVRFNYVVGMPSGTSYLATASSDLDGDGTLRVLDVAKDTTGAVTGCSGAGGQVGLCTATDVY
jgi:type IV pilus assembly protein PilA